MKQIITLALLIFQYQIGISQIILSENSVEIIEEPQIIDASYKGGINNFYNYVSTNFNFNNLKNSDILDEFKNRDVMMIYLEFVINEEGKPVDFKPINTAPENSFYLESVRVIESTRWKPATKDNIAIAQEFRIPIQAYIRDFQE